MPRHPLNALLRLIAITYREKFYVRIIILKFILFDQLLVSYLLFKVQIRLLTSYGGGYRDRTDDLLNANQALSQLS